MTRYLAREAREILPTVPFPNTVRKAEAEAALAAWLRTIASRANAVAAGTLHEDGNKRSELRTQAVKLRDEARALPERLTADNITRAQAKKRRDQIFRELDRIDAVSESLNARKRDVQAMKADPVAWHDEQMQRFPAMRDTLPDLPF